MSKLWEYQLTEEDNGKKFERILLQKFHFSRRLIQQLKQGEKVWVNDKFSYLTARGFTGDIIRINLFNNEESNRSHYVPSVLIKYNENRPETSLASFGLDILYEDDYLLAANKPAGLVVHPNPRYPSGTLANAVVSYWESKGESRTFRPVYRLDRNTSGVIIIAKNHFTHQQLAWQLNHNNICKNYLGFVMGIVREPFGKIDKPIGLTPGSFIQRMIDTDDGLPSLTYYRVLQHYQKANVSLLEFNIKTGRTHQIRVHCQSIGHPLLGDDLYGGDTSLISRQALHAFMYSFKHPLHNSKVTVRAPFPNDLRRLGQFLKKL